MRLLLLSADYPPHAWSGIAHAVQCQADALAGEGVDVHVLTRGAATHCDGDAVSVRSIGIAFPWRDIAFDCIHLHSVGFAELAFELRRRTRARLVYTAHSLLDRELSDRTERSAYLAIQRAIMSASDAVVFLSAHERALALERMPGLGPTSHVIANSLPSPPPRRQRYSPSGPVVYAGRFARSKGLDLLAEVLPRLRHAWGGRFVVAGGHGDAHGERAVRRLKAELGAALITPGWLSRPELERLFAAAALVLVPSEYEPFGLVALEAMRMGAPVLAADVGGLAENVVAGSGGRVVSSREPDVWYRAAMDLLNDPLTADAIASRGPAFVAARFNDRDLAHRLVREVYGVRAPRGPAPGSTLASERLRGAVHWEPVAAL